MDRLAAMQVFVRVAEAASFRRAADQLDLPPATVSKAVQDLEQRLGTRLLQRTTRRVQLTQDGAEFYRRCQLILGAADDAETLFRTDAGGIAGRVRIDLPSRLARLVVIPALPALLQAHPQLELVLGSSDRSVDLVGEGVDCVIRVGPLADSSLVARPLWRFEMLSCASPVYLAVHGRPLTPQDLGEHLMVAYASPNSGRIAPWEWLEEGETRQLPLRHRIAVNSAESYVAACLAGLGLIQVPRYDVEPQLATGALVEVLTQHRPAPLPVSLVFPDRRVPRRVGVVADWLAGLAPRVGGEA